MFVADRPAAMRAWSRQRTTAGRVVALVPTMGALHEGHLALVERARQAADDVVVSIFVNPLQFDRAADLDSYPRPIDDDMALCHAHGVDAVFAPTAAAMYAAGFQTHVEPGPIAERLEGARRPGHFRGVTTVVTKLFNAVEPRVAVFGEKDAQQLAIVRRMVLDLDMGIEVIGVPTVREPDGLAMSSRNRRLSTDQRAAAGCVPRALDEVRRAAAAGVIEVAGLLAAGRSVIDAEPDAVLDHLEIVDAATFDVLDRIPAPAGNRALAVIAVWFGDVRLIDNCPL